MDREPTGKIINPAQQVHGREEIEAGISVLESGRWAEGPNAELFRKALGEFIGVRHVELVNSGSSANLAAILALTTDLIPEPRRIVPGSEVITTALCFPTTVSPIIYAGGIPVFLDVDRTWNIDTDQLEQALTSNTRAIIVAHNLGSPFNLGAVMAFAQKHDLWVIEDNCDAAGARWGDQMTGSIGHIGTSSFYPAHHISTGEGGAIYTNNGLLHRAIRRIINWGRDCFCRPAQDGACGKRYDWQLGGLPKGYDHKNTYASWGLNLKMTDIQAALGIEQLKRLPGFIETRARNFAFLYDLFAQYPGWFDMPVHYEQATPSWFGYVVKLRNAPFTRDEMVLHLDSVGIRSRAFFCGNITRQPVLWQKDGYRVVGDLSTSDDIMNTAFWIGVHPGIHEEEQAYMAYHITKFLNQFKC